MLEILWINTYCGWFRQRKDYSRLGHLFRAASCIGAVGRQRFVIGEQGLPLALLANANRLRSLSVREGGS